MSSEDAKKTPFDFQEFTGIVTALENGRHQIDHLVPTETKKPGIKLHPDSKLDFDLFDTSGHPLNEKVNSWLGENVGKTIRVIVQQIPFPGSKTQYMVSLQKTNEQEADTISFDAEIY